MHGRSRISDQLFACIAGAPRCGTTTLAGFLKDHPDVNFSFVKEPHFFSSRDLARLSDNELHDTVRADYLNRFFRPDTNCTKMLAEGSVSYLYTADRMEPLLRMWPNARFIIAVRNPLEMIPSLHQRLLYMGDETVRDFATAWAMTAQRKEGRNVPPSCVDPRFLRYDEIGRLGHHLDQFFRAVGRERCLVLLFDDLVTDSVSVHRALLDFLGLPPPLHHDYEPRRSGRDYRLGWLQRLLKRPPVATRAYLAGEMYRRRVAPLNGVETESSALRMLFAARAHLLAWNSRPARPIQLPAAVRNALRDAFAEDIFHLSNLIGRDLSHWV